MIDVQDICYYYASANDEQVPALDQVNLQIREGEYIAVMGHNSSGKTTLARCLNGLLIPQKGKNPRRLTPRECARLMGFPENFKIVVSDTRAYRQFGNAVVVPVVRAIAKQMLKYLNKYEEYPDCVNIRISEPLELFAAV